MNYDIGNYKQLQVNKTLELICKNKLNRDPPSWTYHSRLHNDPRMKLTQNVGESRLVISKATAEDAGQYGCSIDHEHNGKTFHFNRTIEVIVYDNKTLNPLPEEPDEDDYWVPPDEKVVVDKSEERWTLRPYKGVNNAELTIANVTENDNGQYFCCARNVAGEMCKDCTVRVTREAAGTGKKYV
ncbi:hypothetical protein B566_EDAN013578 [Ephemera danica]|nr:hypothetical protein B566_EDAN013578 [Ephemera danica]